MLIAYKNILSRLQSAEWHQGQRMPSLARLAQICGVSRTIAWKAVDLLRKESLLHARRGGAIIAGPPGIPRQVAAHDGLLWQRLKTHIGRDALAGMFTGKSLPPVSKLSLRYGTTNRTIKKALDRLVQEGLLILAGHRFAQAPQRARKFQSSIVLITESGTIPVDSRSREVASCFEREGARMGYSCRLEGFSARSARGLIDIRRAIGAIQELRGFIITFWNPWDETIRKRWLDLLAFLTGQNIPIIVIDQAGNFPFPDSVLTYPQLRVLRISGEKAGLMVADVLVRRGHERIAFIAPSYDLHWVRNRYDGICSFIRQYGGPKSTVEIYTVSEIDDQTQQVLAVLDLDKEQIRILYRERFSKDEIIDLQKKMDQVRERNLARQIENDLVTKTIRLMARSMVSLAKHEHDPEVYSQELDRMLNIASNKAIELYQRPFLQKILAKSDATAWVFAEEKSALSAVSFLRSRGKMVPEDIAVFGFDNWHENIELQLSTYDFNMNGFVQQALLMISDAKNLKMRSVISEVDGYVVERRTTRK